MSSWYQWSRPSVIVTSVPVRRTTTVPVTVGHDESASSTLGLRAEGAPRRKPPSAVTTTLQPPSFTRSTIESGEKPPKITEWAAPMRVQASSATGSSGTISM